MIEFDAMNLRMGLLLVALSIRSGVDTACLERCDNYETRRL